MSSERLQKILARAGAADSRRKAETLIVEGAVTVNGKVVTELGTKADIDTDQIKVNGKMLFIDIDPLYVIFYKPSGMISALSDPENRPNLSELLKQLPSRVVPIGRLDFTSEGLLLLTNDGALAEKIVKMKGLPKVYRVKIKGHSTDDELAFLKRGIVTREGVVKIKSARVDKQLESKSWIELLVTEGSNLNLRELLNQRELMVDRIMRYSIGNITVEGMKPGDFAIVKKKDFEALLTQAVSLDSSKPAPRITRPAVRPMGTTRTAGVRPGSAKPVPMIGAGPAKSAIKPVIRPRASASPITPTTRTVISPVSAAAVKTERAPVRRYAKPGSKAIGKGAPRPSVKK